MQTQSLKGYNLDVQLRTRNQVWLGCAPDPLRKDLSSIQMCIVVARNDAVWNPIYIPYIDVLADSLLSAAMHAKMNSLSKTRGIKVKSLPKLLPCGIMWSVLAEQLSHVVNVVTFRTADVPISDDKVPTTFMLKLQPAQQARDDNAVMAKTARLVDFEKGIFEALRMRLTKYDAAAPRIPDDAPKQVRVDAEAKRRVTLIEFETELRMRVWLNRRFSPRAELEPVIAELKEMLRRHDPVKPATKAISFHLKVDKEDKKTSPQKGRKRGRIQSEEDDTKKVAREGEEDHLDPEGELDVFDTNSVSAMDSALLAETSSLIAAVNSVSVAEAADRNVAKVVSDPSPGEKNCIYVRV